MKLNFHCPSELVTQIKARGSRRDEFAQDSVSESIRQSLSRYYYLLGRARAEIKGQFAESEIALICDVCNGTFWGPHSLDMVYANVEDSQPDGTYQKWGVDGPALVAKLRNLNILQSAALVDAIERFWRASGTGLRVAFGSLLE